MNVVGARNGRWNHDNLVELNHIEAPVEPPVEHAPRGVGEIVREWVDLDGHRNQIYVDANGFNRHRILPRN